VTAVDSDPAAIERLRHAAPEIDARLADLERGEYTIEPASFDLICDFLYLQRDLFAAIREGVRPGGVFVGAIRLDGTFALNSGELRDEFRRWKISYYSESGGLARIVARRA
jgi:SAM-dependent methyltransferase